MMEKTSELIRQKSQCFGACAENKEVPSEEVSHQLFNLVFSNILEIVSGFFKLSVFGKIKPPNPLKSFHIFNSN